LGAKLEFFSSCSLARFDIDWWWHPTLSAVQGPEIATAASHSPACCRPIGRVQTKSVTREIFYDPWVAACGTASTSSQGDQTRRASMMGLTDWFFSGSLDA
jgi:hypothetical protein